MISIQLFVITAGTPNHRLNLKQMKDKTQVSMESNGPAEEDLLTLMQRYTDYNHWANQQFAEWLNSASGKDLNLEIQSSYSNLKETILHIWSAEYLWLQIIRDESTDNNPAKDFDGTKDELFNGWIKASENFNNHLKSMSLEELQSKRPRSRGNGYTAIVDMIHHCMNHSTYHRGQLITMGRQAGLTDPPRTDFIYYVGLVNE
jgi:uncharacterized damage-inducible protein DinB